MKTSKAFFLILSIAATAFAFSACGGAAAGNNTAATGSNTAAGNNTAAGGAGKPNATFGNTSGAADANPGSAKSKTEAYTPAKDSAERTLLMDALRVPIAEELKQDVIFTVDKLKVQGEWAFFAGQPKNKEGGEPNWKITKYQKFIDSGDFEQGLFALFKKKDDKWEVVKYLMNCHDVCYLGWEQEYKAPKGLFD